MNVAPKEPCLTMIRLEPVFWLRPRLLHQASEECIHEKNFIDITKRISGDLRKLRQDIPDTMRAFSALAQAAGRDGALDKKTKELIALAIAIATRCDGCIGFHMEALVRLGATR